MRRPAAWTLLVLAFAVPAVPVATASSTEAHGRVQFAIERTRAKGPASFKFTLVLSPGEGLAFLGALTTALDRRGRPGVTRPLHMMSVNEHRDPTVYSGPTELSSCDVGACETGSTWVAVSWMSRNDDGPTDTPTVVVVGAAEKIRWTFTGDGYRLRRVRPSFRFVTGSEAGATGVDYLGSGAEVFTGGASLPGGSKGSLAAGAAPCSGSGSNVVPRGVGRVRLVGGSSSPVETCPIQDGSLAGSTASKTMWHLEGQAAGDQTLAGARLLVVDLPLRTL